MIKPLPLFNYLYTWPCPTTWIIAIELRTFKQNINEQLRKKTGYKNGGCDKEIDLFKDYSKSELQHLHFQGYRNRGGHRVRAPLVFAHG